MIAVDVSAAAGPPPLGGIGETARRQVEALLRVDPETRYALCYRFARWRKGPRLPARPPRVRRRVYVEALAPLLLADAALLHSLSHHLPARLRAPRLVTIHDLNQLRNPHWSTPRHLEKRQRRLRALVERADCVIAPSRFTAGELEELFRLPAERIRVVPNGVDPREFERPAEAELAAVRARHGDFVLGIGLFPRKNFARVVEALRALPELRLVLVGKSGRTAEAVMARARELGLAERVIRREDVPQRELLALLGAARALAVPSLYEGFGLIVLEAMACGTPVVCSDAGSLPEVAGDAALVVDARDPESIAAALRRVGEDEALADELRARGRKRAEAFSWEASARRLREVYREVAGV